MSTYRYSDKKMCNNCGALISVDSEFCTECGVKLDVANSVTERPKSWFAPAGDIGTSGGRVIERECSIESVSDSSKEKKVADEGEASVSGATSWFVTAGNLGEISTDLREPIIHENRCQKCGRVIPVGESLCYSCAESERRKEHNPPEENHCVKCGRVIPKGEVLCYACAEEAKKQEHKPSFFEKYRKQVLVAVAACFVLILAMWLVNPNRTAQTLVPEGNTSSAESSGSSSNVSGADKTTTAGGKKDKADSVQSKDDVSSAVSSEPSKAESPSSEISEKENAGKESSVVIDDVTTIEITWDGRYKNGNLQKLTPSFTGSDTDDIDSYVEVVNKREGYTVIAIKKYDGIINFAVGDDGELNTEVDNLSTICQSGVSATITLPNGDSHTYDLETGLYKSYTGYWFWAPFAIKNGRITDYDSSWLDVSWEAPESAPESTPKPTKSPESAVFSAGRYVCYDHDGYLAADLTINKDGTFCMTVNLFEGYGTIKGTCELVSSGDYYCVVDDRDFYGFIGDDVNSFSLIMADDGSGDLIADGFHMIGMLRSGNVLEKVN